MTIKVQIEVDDRVITLTIEEARKLYDELALLFKRDEVYPIYPSPPWWSIEPTWTGTPYYPESSTKCST